MPDDPLANLFQSEFSIAKDCALIGRAARLGWHIPPERRALLLDRLFGIVESDEDTRNAVAAAKAILSADAINQRREVARDARRAAKNAKPAVQVNVNTAVQVNNVQEAVKDPEYLEWLESKALAADSDAGPLCPPRLAELENDAASLGDQPSTGASL